MAQWLLKEGRPTDGIGILLVEVAGLRTMIGSKAEVGFVFWGCLLISWMYFL